MRTTVDCDMAAQRAKNDELERIRVEQVDRMKQLEAEAIQSQQQPSKTISDLQHQLEKAQKESAENSQKLEMEKARTRKAFAGKAVAELDSQPSEDLSRPPRIPSDRSRDEENI